MPRLCGTLDGGASLGRHRSTASGSAARPGSGAGGDLAARLRGSKRSKVSGHRETSEIDILERLGLDGWTSLIGFDAEAARGGSPPALGRDGGGAQDSIPTGSKSAVEERQPFAHLAARQRPVADRKRRPPDRALASEQHATLPLVIGHGAAGSGAAASSTCLRRLPELAPRVKGYIRVVERRWDLRLENGVTVKLPEARRGPGARRRSSRSTRRTRSCRATSSPSTCGLPTVSSSSSRRRRRSARSRAQGNADKPRQAGAQDMSWLGQQRSARRPHRHRHRARHRLEQDLLHDRPAEAVPRRASCCAAAPIAAR